MIWQAKLSTFQFERDTFSFANDLFWKYECDPQSGRMTILRNPTPPVYTRRCFVMVRSARQFFYHARFEAGQPAADESTYRRLIRQVVARSPRRPSAEGERIVIPGYDGLRAFSEAQARLLQAECGGAWQSYFLRSHWRMVFPVSRRHQQRIAGQLRESLRRRAAPIVHLFRFPRITINHGIVLFNCRESAQEIAFEAYDPNLPAHPVTLTYQRPSRTFYFPPLPYWPGGSLQVIEIYCGGLY